MSEPFSVMQFVHRIPWDSDDPDVIEVLETLVSKGVDFKDGNFHVRISLHADPNAVVWYHVETKHNGTRLHRHTFLLENQRAALEYFVVECNRIEEMESKQKS